MNFKPLLAGKADLDKLSYPLLGAPKLDGIRGLVRDRRLVTRKLLDVPNKVTFDRFRDYEGLDGELIAGDPSGEGVYGRSYRAVMGGRATDEVTYWVFDWWDRPDMAYVDRLRSLTENVQLKGGDEGIKLVPHQLIENRDELDEYEAEAVQLGYEGIMLRSLTGKYKHGRSTTNEGILLKVKRYEDAEAVIVGTEEEMHNGNEAQRDHLGRTKRSTSQEGKTGKGTMGALAVRGLGGRFDGIDFNIGSGFTAAQRTDQWLPGEIVKYKYFPVGVLDRPRHPVFLGRRDARDMS